MKNIIFIIIINIYSINCLLGQSMDKPQKFTTKDHLQQNFLHPPEDSKPWVYWYWMRSAVTREGITADLQAMKELGIGGAYLMTIRETTKPPFITPPVVPLTPEWWSIIRFTMSEANRIGISLAMTPCDGWALAGGPWITPELSMQKVVWTKTTIKGGKVFNDVIKQPESYQSYYKDIAIYAYPSLEGSELTTKTIIPKITSNAQDPNVQLLLNPGNKKDFSSTENCWIQLEFLQPFTCRSLSIRTNKSNYQSERLMMEISNDGKKFTPLDRLQAPRHGWQDAGNDITYSINPVTAKYFRFVYDPKDSEPGSEDLDLAKWKPELIFCGIELSSEPKINQFEGKNGEVWRIGKRTTNKQLPDELCIPGSKLINITDKLTADGRLEWNAPNGEWTILRIGHTSTGYKNAAAGSARGLECDKFSPEAAKIQFDNWFGEALKQNGLETTKQILKIFHVDSWECGSQNWSKSFDTEFKKRRGYDLLNYLPVMAGVPVESAAVSEKVLSDVRETIAELITDNFFGTFKKLANSKGCTFSAESVAPTMTSDGMLHFSQVDIPMGEFWFRSPTHDKPNDILDAISGGHIYGKNIIQAEAFTELRLMWDEHPAMLKTLMDRNFALGINRNVLHVNTHNPWTDRMPGLTLDGVGLFLQRDQTWWKPGKAWIKYMQRCQAMLQQGKPVVDIAVFTGEETPRRAIMPDRLVSTLPGIFGKERILQEADRLANKGIPLRSMPKGIISVANMADPEKWVDPLRGYAYDSFNKDVLLRLAKVNNGRIELPGGASYGVLVIPGVHPMSPNGELMSVEVIEKLTELAKQGATIIFNCEPTQSTGMQNDTKVKRAVSDLFSISGLKILKEAYQNSTFDKLNIKRDVILTDQSGKYAADIAWTHRGDKDFDIYFISNQNNSPRTINVSLRSSGNPELWDALTGEIRQANNLKVGNRTSIPLRLEANGSIFIVMQNGISSNTNNKSNWPVIKPLLELSKEWKVSFNSKYGGPKQPIIFKNYEDWGKSPEESIKHYSGTASYTQQFNWQLKEANNVWLELGEVFNLAEVYVNGINCGVAWTPPYRINISKALKPGNNTLKIEVTNTWANRLIGDMNLPENKRITWTNGANYLQKDNPLLPAGLKGPAKLVRLNY